jgi:transglutaminase-like putative cysteine protease
VYVHKKLPNSVKIAGYKFSMPEYLYLVSKTIQYKYKNDKSSIVVKYGIKDPQNIRGTSIYGNISLKTLHAHVKEVINYINYYKVAPNFISTNIGSIQYQTLIFVFSKLGAKNQLPTTISLNIASSNSLTETTPKYTRSGMKNILNSKYKGAKSKYLLASKNSQSKDSYIKELSKIITKGCKTKLEKAKAIYYWVRDNIDYVYYYNTKYGAKKTIFNKKGNCVDKSHAIVALCRAIKIPARYVHGKCKFVSGKWTGHVWTQILVGKTWYVADASSYELNGFGVVNNWDASSYKLYNTYGRLVF